MTRSGYFLRLALCIAIDAFDFSLGRVPILGSVTDGISSLVLFLLWGPVGLLHLWELIDITDNIDGFVPTATLIALYAGWKDGHLTGKSPAPTERP